MDDLKILTLDIETKPALAYTWKLFDSNIGLNQVVDPGGVICFAAKWYDRKQVMFHSEYKDGLDGMAVAARRLMDEADLIVHYNGSSFDEKHLHALMIEQGLTPPSPHRPVDLMRIVKSRFRFLSNKLQHVSEQLNVGSKLQHSGFDLWSGWMNGDEKAVRLMERYCKQDVRLTEELFDALREWIPATKLPTKALVEGTAGDVCPHCGHDDLYKNGFHYTPAGSAYQRWRCKECDKVCTDRSRVFATNKKGL